ncbi:MAG: carbohydrate binding family 9 domain-containing protein, partial [Gemmatimonadota bacterium]|nr:carbohydrate binding family 9 domain-containing protein [Gemmatimonadota bacterium]
MRSITVRAVFALASIIPTLPLAAQQEDGGGEAARPVVQATRLTAGIVVDGRLEDAAWASARVVTGFTQVDPEEGRPVSQPTEARILFDDEALYVGLRLFDDQPVSTRLGRRDMDLLDADWVGVVIDSYHDHRTAYSFDVNPSGVQRDATKSMSTRGHEQDDLSWDAVWDAAASIDDDGWTAEYRIPFSQLRFAASADPTWGIQIERVIGRRREYAVLSFTPKSEQGGIPTYGHLVGMNDVRPGKRLEVLPYAVQRSEYVGDGVRPPTNGDHSLSGGMDLLYRVTSDFTLNATANPDFGQVEVDPAVINLSVYETFYEEKRPFFVEGSEIFDFGRNTSGGQIFYSRRIGRRPQIGLPRGVTTVEVPDNTSILGAAKLSGKTSGGWSVGVMEAVTAEERGHFLDTGGLSGDAVVEPLANYLVSRVRKDSEDGRTSIGGMFTAANRRLPTDELRAVLRDGAYAGGIDFRHEFANRTWVVQGSAVGSRVEGDVRSLVGLQRLG